MSNASLPKSMQEARLVYKLSRILDNANVESERTIQELPFVIACTWSASVMDVWVRVAQGAEATALRWMDETIRGCIEKVGGKIL